jgi:pyrroline-5-carboxylate reductase
MGKMILNKYLESGARPDLVYASTRTREKLLPLREKYPDVHICGTNSEAAAASDILFLCVKPFDIKGVLLEMMPSFKKSVYLVSINDSLQIADLEKVCGRMKISKIVPSVTAEINQSCTLTCHNALVTEADKEALRAIVKTFGTVTEVPEDEIELGSEMMGCMPGFISAILNVFVDEAEKHAKTLTREQLADLACRTASAVGTILATQGIVFRELISRVATKGGITEEGVKVLDEKLPAIAAETLAKTLAKRKLVREQLSAEFSP